VRNWRSPLRQGAVRSAVSTTTPVVHTAYRDGPKRTPLGPARCCRPKQSGSTRHAAVLIRPSRGPAWGTMSLIAGGRAAYGKTRGRGTPARKPGNRRLRADLTRRCVSAERFRPLRHDRQCLGVDHRLVLVRTHRRPAEAVLHSGRIRAAGRRPAATIRASRRSGFLARW